MSDLQHRALYGPQVHAPAFVSDTDPALDVDNDVRAKQAWVRTGSTPITLFIRNNANTDWFAVGEVAVDVIQEGLHASRPAASADIEAHLYYEIDTDTIFFCTGADWDPWPITYTQLTNVPTAFAPTAHDHASASAGDGGILTNDKHDGYLEIGEISIPSTPPANTARLYVKDLSGVSRLYYRDDAGTEFELPGASSGAPSGASYITGASEAGLSAELVLGTSVLMYGTHAGRPTPGTTGVYYYETDTRRLFRWNGASWDAQDTDWANLQNSSHDHTATAGDGGKLSGATVDTFMAFEEQGSAPATPAANVGRLYTKDVSGETILFFKSDAGNEYQLTAGGGVGGAPNDCNYVTGSGQSGLTSELVLGSAVIMRGVTGSRPAASLAGLLYIDTTTGIIYRDNGSTWDEIARAETATRLAQLSDHAHTSLSSVGANDHHNQAHDHTGGDGSGVLTNDEHDGYSLYTNIAAPSTPASGKTLLYMSTGKHLHVKDDAGLDLDLSQGADPTTTAGDLIIRNASNIYTRLGIGSLAQVLAVRGGTPIPTWEYVYTSLDFVIDGGGSVIATGVKGDIPVGFDGTIVEAILLGDQTGSIEVEIQKCTYSQFDGGATHPVTGDKINSGTPPTITSNTKSSDTTLSSWTTAISAGDILRFVVNSCSGLTRCTVSLRVRRA